MTTGYRLLGILPLVFFIAHAHYYWVNGGLGNVLWMCNVGNLLLAVGLLLNQPLLIRVAVIWLIPGLPLWFWYVVLKGGWLLTSTFAHVGGLIVGLIALAKVRMCRRTWVYAIIWYLLVQQISRVVTPVWWNVNIAHTVYGGWEGAFSAYWQFWLATTLAVAVGLWALGYLLLKLWPPLAEPKSPG